MKRWFWLFPLLLLAGPLLAAPSIFSIPSTDQSQLFLMQIFGQVGGFLPGARLGQNPLKDALYYFNNVVMIAGGLVVLYTTIVATVNTAHDGEVLGKNWKSVWIPVRTALGFALLLPVGGGYSIIQALVMWVVLQGVGAADYVWFKYADGIAKGSYLTVKNNAFTGASSVAAIEVPTNQIFNNLVCAHVGQLMMGGSGSVIQQTAKSYNFNINGMKPDGICGSVDRVADSKVDGALESYIKQIDSTAAGPYAQQQYDNSVALPGEGSSNNYPGDEKIASALQAAVWQYNSDISQLATAAAVETGGNSEYQSYIRQFKDQANTNGWIYAGALYLLIMNIQSQSPDSTSSGQKASTDLVNSASPLVSPYNIADINLGPQSNVTFAVLLSNASNFTDGMTYASPNAGLTLKCTPMKTKTRGKDVMNDLTYDCNSVLSGWLSATGANKLTGNSNQTNYTPIINLAQWGQNTINTIMWSWIALLVAITAGAVGNIVLSIFGLGSLAIVLGASMTAIMAFLTPIIAFIMSIYWVNGSIAGYYIPMLPFLIYSVSAVGWILLVVEAMVAAPLMALGVLHPEGRHEVMGSAQQGFEILLGVFLRPMLMVVGFIAASVVVTVIIDLVNAGFYMATLNLFASGKLITLWTTMILFTMYMTTMFTLINRGFTLIYLVPDRVLRWIGMSPESTSEADVQAIRGGFDQTSKQGLTTTQQLGQGAMTAAGEMQKTGQELKKEIGS